jgi:phospholipid/cholesterol/gamma-HCH transport system substrate-binding protein
MQQYTKLEFAVGGFMVVGIAALAYLSVSLGGLDPFASNRYEITARFSSVGGLKPGDPVKIAGVTIGEVGEVRLVDYAAEAELSLDRSVELSADTIASIQSNGLLGDAYVSLSPGADDKTLTQGGRITRTEPAISLTELIAKYAFGSPVPESSEEKAAEIPVVQPAAAQPSAQPSTDGSNPNTAISAPSATGAAKEKPSPFSDPLE